MDFGVAAEPLDVEDKLHGQLVKQIWMCSRLDKKVLKEIWSECDPKGTGYIDKDAFVQGMWRIDDELARRAARRPVARR